MIPFLHSEVNKICRFDGTVTVDMQEMLVGKGIKYGIEEEK